ncbi:MAG: hypothetical protein CMA64_00300 [Euryarchaeota archaeon]|jgi:hypothetical protein|nr:hypothetical protein [Euryarchaeota archaeon]
MNKILTFGDQLIASPGPRDGFHIDYDKHWWKLLADEREKEVELLSDPLKHHSISPLYYASQILQIDMNKDDSFISVVPSSERSTSWDGKYPKHLATVDQGPHQFKEYQLWQNDFALTIISKWAEDKDCYFVVQQEPSFKLDSNKFFVIPKSEHEVDMNNFWRWVMLEHKDLSHPGHFYEHCAPTRSLNEFGHKCVYEVISSKITRSH